MRPARMLPDPDPDHLRHACDLALAMVHAMPALNTELGTGFQLRVGVNTGSAVAGVVGTSKFRYDVWGDTVNLASRLESNGTPGAVAVSEGVARALDGQYTIEAVGTKDLKGQGPTAVHRLLDRPPSQAQGTSLQIAISSRSEHMLRLNPRLGLSLSRRIGPALR